MGSEVLIETPTYLMAAVIDLDMTFFIQMVVFLLLYILLSNFFFKPYTRYLSRRDESTAGLRTTAHEMVEKATSIEKSIQSRLEEARQAGIAERVKAVTEAAAVRDRLIAQEREKLQGMVDREVANLAVARDDFLKKAAPAIVEVADAIERQIESAEGGRG